MKFSFSGKMKFFLLLCVCIIFSLFLITVSAAEVFEVKNSSVLLVSDDNWWDRGVQYGRILCLSEKEGQDEVLLATHCILNAGLTDTSPGYPIYKSTDGGYNWEKISFVADTLTGLNSEWNPCLFELKKPCGQYPSGTVVLAACSVDAEHKEKSHIRLYFSADGGHTFSRGVIAASGGGLDEGVWEPFLIQLDDGRLVCFYSDESDPFCSQKIVYKVSSDGENWGEAEDAVASEFSEERPGMPVVTRLGDGSYFMVYEVVDKIGVDGNPVYFRRSDDGLNWGEASFIGEELLSKNGKKALGSAPYCGWTPEGSENGTLIISGTFMRKGESDTGTDYFISYDYGKSWKTVPHIIPYTATGNAGYSNSFAFSADGKTMYSINNPANPENPEKSKIVVAAAHISEKPSEITENPIAFIAFPVVAVFLIVLFFCVKRKKKN